MKPPPSPSSPLVVSPEQRAALWQAKLSALARDGLGRTTIGSTQSTPWGAALDSDGHWVVLVEADPERAFGQALVLADRNGARSIEVLVVADHAGAVARRAELFAPRPVVWAVTGTDLNPAAPHPLAPSVAVETTPAIQVLIGQALTNPELRVVDEHGERTIEFRGVEVAKVVGVGSDQRLDVGVGAYDQGAFAVMNPDLDSIDSLHTVVDLVAEHRTRGAEPHPLNRLVRERWLRAELIDDPSVLGLTELTAVEAPTPRGGLHDQAPAFARGIGSDREVVVVATSVGIDLDLVPAAADVAAREGADRIVVVLPDRDCHPLVQALAERCCFAIDFVSADEPWAR